MTAVYDIVYLPLGAAAFGGAERSLLELAAAQQAAGSSVLVCYDEALDATEFADVARSLGVSVRCISLAPSAGLRGSFREACALFRSVRAGVIHFNISWRPHMWCVPLAARLLGRAKLVGTMRAMPEAFGDLPHRRYLGFIPGPRVWAWPDYITGRVWANTLHAVASVNRDDYPPRMVSAFGFHQHRLFVVYNGVRIPAHAPTLEERREAREALGVRAGRFLVAYVGRVSSEKGVRYLVEALTKCADSVDLVIAGDGSELEALRQLVSHLALEDRVRFLGYVSPATAIFQAADVAVVPSLWNEAFGRVVVEAMACGTAVVATAVGGMQEIFTDGKQGLLVPKADSDAIAAAIERLRGDASFRMGLAEAAFQHVSATFSTERVSAQYSELYARVTSQA